MAMNLEELHQLLLERNTLETFPYLAIHEANATLLNQLDALQLKCEALERQNAALGSSRVTGGSSNSSSGNGDSAALRNETRLREKVEKLQEELNEKLRVHQQATMQALDTANALAQAKESNTLLEQKLKMLAQEVLKKDKAITHLTQQLEDSKSTTKLAEQQYMGLKETIRSLQKENDVVKDENRKLIDRLVNDKEKTSDEMNSLNEMVDHLKKEVEMLRTLKLQDDKRRSWFGTPGKKSDEEEQVSSKGRDDTEKGAKFGATGTVIPSSIQTLVTAHNGEASCVRYDSSGADLVATCGTDSCVKVWDTSNGTLKATLRGALVIGACDIGDDLAVGGGSDKMCRVWNLKTQRMVNRSIRASSLILCFVTQAL
jgi:autophagy-related protein 16